MRVMTDEERDEAEYESDDSYPLSESEPDICPSCNGSGEGQYDGTRCSNCKGRGEV